jgi:hypothetical protein
MTSVEEKRTALPDGLKINKTNDFISTPPKRCRKSWISHCFNRTLPNSILFWGWLGVGLEKNYLKIHGGSIL